MDEFNELIKKKENTSFLSENKLYKYLLVILLLTSLIFATSTLYFWNKTKQTDLKVQQKDEEIQRITSSTESKNRINNANETNTQVYPLAYSIPSRNNLLKISPYLGIELPKDSVMDNDSVIITFNNASFRMNIPNNLEGCPGDVVSNDCKNSDEAIGRYGTLRIWKNSKGIFALNPYSIELDNQYVNHLVITKLFPDAIFTNEEVATWKKSFESLQIIDN